MSSKIPHHAPPRRRRRAFSLVELMITLVIASVVFSIAAPRFISSVERFRVDSAARRLVGDLAYAKRQARATGTSRRLVFNVAAGSYSVTGLPSLGTRASDYLVVLGAAPYFASIDSVVCDNAFDAADSATEIVFDPYGSPDSGGTIVVRMGSATRTVTIDPVSGEADIS